MPIEEGRALIVEEAVGVLLVRRTLVPQVAELERHRGPRSDVPVDPDRFAGREEVVGPAALEQHGGGGTALEPVALMVLEYLVRYGSGGGVLGLAGLDTGKPRGQVGARVGAGSRPRRRAAIRA